MRYHNGSTRSTPPAPPEFVQQFIAGGWRKVERLYGARTDLLLKWIELSGGQSLHTARAAYMRETGKGGPCRRAAVEFVESEAILCPAMQVAQDFGAPFVILSTGHRAVVRNGCVMTILTKKMGRERR